MKVFVSQRIYPEGLEILERAGLEVDLNDDTKPLPKKQLIERAKGADGLLCLLTDTVDAEVLKGAPDLKVVSNVAVGYNNIGVETAIERGVLVTNTPDVLNEATADLAFALLLGAARRLPEADRYLREGKFEGWELFQPHLGLDVWGKTLGVVDMGRIGEAVARRAKGFNMNVLYHNRSRLDPDVEQELGTRYVSFNELLEESDFISVHVPLTDETRHLLDREAFKKMKETAVFINTARGPVVDEAALAEALKAGELRGAGLDVFEGGPEVHSKLLELQEHLVLVPHIGSATHETRRRMSTLAAENMAAALTGSCPPSLVNRDTWEDSE